MNFLVQNLVGLSLLASILFKLTVLLAVAWTIHFALARLNPRWRVLLWRNVIVGLMVVPPTEWLMPKLRVPVDAPPAPSLTVAEPAAMPLPQNILEVSRLTLSPSPVTNSSHVSRVPATDPWLHNHFSLLLALGWGIGFAILSTRMLFTSLRLARMLRASQPAPERICALAQEISIAIRCGSRPDLRVIGGPCSPFAAGLRRPVVVLPEPMLEPQYEPALPAILAHELAHLRSQDLVWILLARWISVALWFHPLVWRMRAAHGFSCEAVCDGVAAELTGGVRAYSSTLANTFLDLVIDSSAPVGVPMVRTAEITRRIRQIRLGISTGALTQRRVAFAMILGMTILGGLGGLKLVQAQPDKLSSDHSYLVKLPDRVSVEIVGVCDYLKDKKRWWRPDGMPLNTIPYAKTNENLTKNPEAMLAFAFRILGGQDPGEVCVEFSDPRAGQWNCQPDDADGHPINDMKAVVGVFNKNHDPKLDIEVKVKAGPPEVLATYRDNNDMDMRTYQFEGGGVIFHKPREDNGALVFSASHTDFGSERGSYFIAYDKAGKEHGCSASNNSKTNGFEMGEYKFQDLRPAELDRIEYRTQRYTRIIFKNVSLSADLKTEFCFEVKPAPKSLTELSQSTPQKKISQGEKAPDNKTPSLAQARIIHFPGKLSLGKFKLLDHAIIDRWHEHWVEYSDYHDDNEFDEALDEITVPAGKGLVLYVDEKQAGDLSFLDAFKPDDIQVLDLAHLEALKDQDLAHLGKLTGLKVLSLHASNVSDAGIKYLKPLTSLRFLMLNHTRVTGKGLAQLQELKSLDSLQIHNTLITNDGLAALTGLPRLKHLRIGGKNISDAGLTHIKDLGELESLWIQGSPVTDAGMANLSSLRSLKELQVNGADVTEAGLAALQGLKQLEQIDWDITGDAGLDCLSRLPALKILGIYLRSDVTMASLPAFKRMHGLRHLTLGGDGLSDDLLAAVHAALPACRISDCNRGTDYPPPAWLQQFEAVYSLHKGEVLKRIAPPFIPERKQYFQSRPGWTKDDEPPTKVVFHWTGSLQSGSETFGGPTCELEDYICTSGQFSTDMLSGPADVLKLKVPAVDWLIDDKASQSQRLAALEKILADEMGLKIRIEKKTVERDVIVASGRYKPAPQSDPRNMPVIKVTLGENQKLGMESQATIADLLRRLGDLTRRQVINNVAFSPRDQFEIESTVSAKLFEENVDQQQQSEALQKIFDSLTKQTGVQFKNERRPVEIWVVTKQ